MSTAVIYSKKKLKRYKENEILENIYLLSKKSFKQIEINGSGVFNSSFYSNNHNFGEVKEFINKDNVESTQINMRGSICVYTKSSDSKSFYIIPDPLGSAIVFYYDSPNLKIFSNSITKITSILETLSITVSKNVFYQYETTATGNGGLFHSPYQDIYSLKPFQYVFFEDNSYFIKNNNKLNNILEEASKYSKEYLLNTLIEDVENNIKLVSNEKNKGIKISHLTGGFDSRLILSAIYKLGYKDKYTYFCSGRKGSPDKDISISLSRHFGLTHTDYSGYRSIKSLSGYKERIEAGFDFTGGILSNINPYIEKEDNIILSGGYGELIRSFYGKNLSINNYSDYSELVSKLWPNLNTSSKNSIFSNEFKNVFVERFTEIIREANELGIPDENNLDYYYQRIRNRYFVGQISFINSNFNARFDPLYSPVFSVALLFQAKKLRTSNYFGIEMMKYFNRDLIQLPFDSSRINADYVSLKGIIPVKKFSENYALKNFRPAIELEKSNLNKEIPATKSHEIRANKMQAWLWQVKEEGNAKDGLKNIIGEIDDKYLNKDYINKIINSEITNRVDLRTLHLLYSNLLWFSKK